MRGFVILLGISVGVMVAMAIVTFLGTPTATGVYLP